VAQAILALRENEDARHQLAALKSEIDGLQQELEAATQSLAVAATTEQAQQASLQRQEILNRVQSNAMVSQAWTDWVMVGPVGYPSPWVGVAPAQALLTRAWGLYPASPHVPAAQRVIVANPPAAPPQIVVPTTQPVLPGARTTPLTLNEVSHTTPTTPVHLGNQSSGANQALPTRAGSRTFSDMRQLPLPTPSSGSGPSSGQQTMSPKSRSLRQFLESPGGTPPPGTVPSRGRQNLPPGSRSIQSLRQFLQPPGSVSPAAQPPAARAVPPQMQSPLLVPRMPYHFAPRGLGNTGRQSGAGLGRYGGGRAGGGRGGGRGR
jgi:hypothetical protein